MLTREFVNGSYTFKGIFVTSGDESSLQGLPTSGFVSLDTETTGITKQDKPFSIQVSDGLTVWYVDIREGSSYPFALSSLFRNPEIKWFIHNAIFDLTMLKSINQGLAGTVYCTLGNAKLINNKKVSYSLKNCAKEIGLTKDTGVEDYIQLHKLYKVDIQKKFKGTKKVKHPDFAGVPDDLMFEYGVHDAFITYQLGMWQMEQLKLIAGRERWARCLNSPS